MKNEILSFLELIKEKATTDSCFQGLLRYIEYTIQVEKELKEYKEKYGNIKNKELSYEDWLETLFPNMENKDIEIFFMIDFNCPDNPIRELGVYVTDRVSWSESWRDLHLNGFTIDGVLFKIYPQDIGTVFFRNKEEALAMYRKQTRETKCEVDFSDDFNDFCNTRYEEAVDRGITPCLNCELRLIDPETKKSCCKYKKMKDKPVLKKEVYTILRKWKEK